jgi:hypothetical protein
MTRDRWFYSTGSALYLVSGYFALQLMGAPMDAVNELLKVVALSLGFVVGICALLYASANRWLP